MQSYKTQIKILLILGLAKSLYYLFVMTFALHLIYTLHNCPEIILLMTSNKVVVYKGVIYGIKIIFTRIMKWVIHFCKLLYIKNYFTYNLEHHLFHVYAIIPREAESSDLLQASWFPAPSITRWLHDSHTVSETFLQISLMAITSLIILNIIPMYML